ncbi:MAG: glucose/galactose MFS transporter [Acidocella sp. 20-57-95]|nr:MAG: glucose/galactose MFS transporter [Acidocella sp. 20-57-95]HQT63972.1 sugar MFS transporter [Acidocella sp.]HQU04267.1 sugar MFS transporter [Acidocella sp.]
MGQTNIARPAWAAPLVTTLFFAWGFSTALNDTLVPKLKALFSLNYTEAMLIQFCFFTAYFVMSWPSAQLIAKLGYMRGIVTGLVIMAVGCLLFTPAARMGVYPLFLLAFFILATGITLLQVAANPLMALLGSEETASSRLNFAQAFNSFGTFIAPLIGGFFILGSGLAQAPDPAQTSPAVLSAFRSSQAAVIQPTYIVIAGIFLVFALIFWLVRRYAAAPATGVVALDLHVLRRPQLALGCGAIFVYVGAEVAIGSLMINYLIQPTVFGVTAKAAAYYVSLYWGGAMVGRVIGAAVLRFVRAGIVLGVAALGAAALAATAGFNSGWFAGYALIAIGLCNSIQFPTIFTLGIDRLGDETPQGSGLLCMAIVGGAIVPVLVGVLIDQVGLAHALLLPVLCYLYIAAYGFWTARRSHVFP